jgi:hypothetical protein
VSEPCAPNDATEATGDAAPPSPESSRLLLLLRRLLLLRLFSGAGARANATGGSVRLPNPPPPPLELGPKAHTGGKSSSTDTLPPLTATTASRRPKRGKLSAAKCKAWPEAPPTPKAARRGLDA